MSTRIVVDPTKLNSTASLIDSQAQDYQKQYTLLFNQVEGMGQAWQGADNLAFVNQIDGFKDDFDKMYSLMKQYSDFLKTSAQAYTSTQQDRISQAKTLTN